MTEFEDMVHELSAVDSVSAIVIAGSNLSGVSDELSDIDMYVYTDDEIPLDYRKRTGYQIYKKALEKGVLLRPLGDIIYFNPPLIIQKEDMDYVINAAYESLKEVLG